MLTTAGVVGKRDPSKISCSVHAPFGFVWSPPAAAASGGEGAGGEPEEPDPVPDDDPDGGGHGAFGWRGFGCVCPERFGGVLWTTFRGIGHGRFRRRRRSVRIVRNAIKHISGSKSWNRKCAKTIVGSTFVAEARREWISLCVAVDR